MAGSGVLATTHIPRFGSLLPQDLVDVIGENGHFSCCVCRITLII